jgi:hypothetical protein
MLLYVFSFIHRRDYNPHGTKGHGRRTDPRGETAMESMWFVSPEHLSSILYCGRYGRTGDKRRGGLVFGTQATQTGLVQFTNQACYWLTRPC